ncbi:MucR family transcriptional regulator [Sphingomonas sp. ac-8]|uniref:MucR family transcriptional regulator n=1 Tax=Sphingomonas sp. ac-8 TaxID=3242977 RepID=UPI003A80CDDB
MADGARDLQLAFVVQVAVAWLANPHHRIAADEICTLLDRVHEGIVALQVRAEQGDMTVQAVDTEHIPAVTVEESLASKDHILSMIDGKPYKALRRHVAAYGLTPEEYRERYRLNPTYPMVAENHSAVRRELARRIGLSGLRKKR